MPKSQSESEFSPRAIGVLIACILAMALGPSSLLTMFSLFMQPMGAELGWNRGQVSSLLTVLGLGSAVVTPLIGKAVDTWGSRRVVLAFSTMFAMAVASLSLINRRLWQLYIVFSIVGLLNAGGVPYGRAIATWFGKQRGLAYGLFGFGMAMLTAILQQIARPLLDAVGWRGTYLTFGAAVLLISVPTTLIFLRDADGVQQSKEVQGEASGVSAIEAWQTRTYWIVCSSLALTMFVAMGLMTHGVAMLTGRGISRPIATTVVSALVVGGMLTQLLIGFLVDRFDTPRIVIPFSILTLIGISIFAQGHSVPIILLSGMAFGAGAGGVMGVTQYWISRYFGLRSFSVIYGSVEMCAILVAVAGGPLLLGALFDSTGSYALGFRVMEAALLISTVSISLLGSYIFPSTRRVVKSASPQETAPQSQSVA